MSPDEDTSYFAQGRDDLVSFILPHVGARGRALDIGCAEGRLGLQLKQAGFAEVWGVDPHPIAAARAVGVLDAVVEGTFPECLPDLNGLFDVVVMADSLEHMVDPWRALRAVRSVLAPGGVLALSVPNVSHLSVALKLLRGRWDYADSGHLDRTHVRFFTPSSLRSTLASEGYEVDVFEPSHSPRRWFELPAVWLLSILAPHMLVFQMYVIARAAEPAATRRAVA